MIPVSNRELAGADGQGVCVLVIDTGVQGDHPVFNGRPMRHWHLRHHGEDVTVEVDGPGGDLLGHGTAIAGIVHQLAPRCDIHSLRALGEGGRASSSLVLQALQWGVEQGYDVVNCSFTGYDPYYLQAYKSVIDRAFCRKVLLVSASNNVDYRRIEYPGSFPTVISTDYGNLEPLTLIRREGHLVEFVACGESVRVAWKASGYRRCTGSSYAAAHLSALVARIRQLRPRWNPCQVKAGLYDLAQHVPAAASPNDQIRMTNPEGGKSE